jgi:hypothetical protein
MLAVSGSVLAVLVALVVAATAETFAHGTLLVIFFVTVAGLAAILGTALALGLVAVILGAPVLVLAGAAWILRKGSRRSRENATAGKDSPS